MTTDSALLRYRAGLIWLALAPTLLAPANAQISNAPSSEVVLHTFRNYGVYAGPVIRDAEGNLYGTTAGGGAPGTIYKLDTTGHIAVLYAFRGGSDGADPQSGVIRDSAGNLYGTCARGGTSNKGVVFKLDAAGHQTVLYAFTGGPNGSHPYTGLIRDAAGNLYGTTFDGGASNRGVVYKLDANGNETVLYSFTGGADGGDPDAAVIRDAAGNLYGTTADGGASGAGVVYELDPSGWETALYSFMGGADGANPNTGVIRESDGNLYGTTSVGGVHGGGTVYKLDTAGKETVLHSFGYATDGSYPSGVIRDSAGNLYGTTASGGPGRGGVVYKLDPHGNESVLYSFKGGADGSGPAAGVVRDPAGNLYGTTSLGGPANGGTVYKVDTTGQETVLYVFNGPEDGCFPRSGLVRDSAGNLYGTTSGCGSLNSGVLYKLDPSSHETVLYSFHLSTFGRTVPSGVILDSEGNLYGTDSGESNFPGFVYELDRSGHVTVLYTFTGGSDGGNPNGLVLDSAGDLYGTTLGGGTANAGVVYKLDPSGHQTVLYSFKGGPDGAFPDGNLVFDSAGNFYGTTETGGPGTAGVVFKLDAAGNETLLHGFTGGSDGGYPDGGVILDSEGNLYGTTYGGGVAKAGVVYKLDPSGHETELYSFTGGADGGGPGADPSGGPFGGLVRDPAGNLYGTAWFGGAANAGVVFKVDPSGHETVLYSFTGGADGGNPATGVILDQAGNLYGTTAYGGRMSAGVVFKLRNAAPAN